LILIFFIAIVSLKFPSGVNPGARFGGNP